MNYASLIHATERDFTIISSQIKMQITVTMQIIGTTEYFKIRNLREAFFSNVRDIYLVTGKLT